MGRRRRRHRRYNNHIWFYSVIACICLLTMGIGYAILSAENNIQIDVTKTKSPALDTIKALLGSSTSVASGTGTLEKISQPATLQTAAQTEYRYRGSNPNNYVTFNGETAGWRIIGIVDGKVKLTRNESIGNYSWDNKTASTGAESNNGKNEWSDSRLMMLLNPQSDGTSYTGTGGSLYWDSGKGTCYSGYNNATTACDFTSTGSNTGLSTAAKAMIDKSTWYLGGWNTASIRTNVMYEKERGNTVYGGRSTKWEGYVGLMYPSDYGYAASSSCSNSYTLNNYENSTCTSNNWLFKNDSTIYWTLAPFSGDFSSAFSESSSVIVHSNLYVYKAKGVRPTVYLKGNVQITGGDGSSSKPYQLTLN